MCEDAPARAGEHARAGLSCGRACVRQTGSDVVGALAVHGHRGLKADANWPCIEQVNVMKLLGCEIIRTPTGPGWF
jgi:hypothetical protein